MTGLQRMGALHDEIHFLLEWETLECLRSTSNTNCEGYCCVSYKNTLRNKFAYMSKTYYFVN